MSATASSAQEAPLYDGSDGATCDYFNQAVRIRWVHRAGDWVDANGTEQGPAAFAQLAVRDTSRAQTLQWDVTRLAAGWLSHAYPNQGILLRTLPGASPGAVAMHSREEDNVAVRPKLILDFADGKQMTSYPTADTGIDCTTVYSIGARKVVGVSNEVGLAIRFDLPSADSTGTLTKATLEMTSPKQFAATTVGVYRLHPPLQKDSDSPQMGLGARYHRDHGIDKDPAVVMATGFESPLWWRDWSEVSLRGDIGRVDHDGPWGFRPLDGNALRVEIPKGKNLGLNVSYKFADKIGHEPEEIYFRYYLRLGSDWSPTTDGGKLPGISGTYGRAGWGGRTSDGTNGWSMRGSFLAEPRPGNPYHMLTAIGTYAYHADTSDFWG
ncbi:MAG: disaggregatase related repeat-containing protein, partial [bacterium]